MCQVVGLSRRAKRYKPVLSEENARIKESMLRLVKEHPRYGYRRITALLRREGWHVNRKRVYRLWKEEGLKVPKRRKKPKNKGHSRTSIGNYPSTHINHVWSWDFVSSSTRNGQELRWLVIIDEYTRECLHLEARRSWPAADVWECLLALMTSRGAPFCMRSDNGPEFIASALQSSLSALGLNVLYVEPGCPWQNGAVESFNASFRDEWLNEQSFLGIAQAKTKGLQFMDSYNNVRPHSSLGYNTPAEYAAKVTNNRSLRFELSGSSATRAAVDNFPNCFDNNIGLELSN